ncbi:TPA: glycosyltransferase family 4 protein [Photobacterium damselae]
MKVLFILADITFVGGIERVISNLSNSFIEENIDVDILSLYKTNESCNFYINENVNVHYLNDNIKFNNKPGSLSRFLKHIKNIRKLKEFLNDNTYDVIISNSFPTSFQLFFSKKRCKWITYEHVYYEYYNKPIRFVRNIIYKKYDYIVTLTNNDRVRFSKRFNNAIQIFNPIGFSSEKKSKLDNKRIIAVGRLEEQKGFDLLIDSIDLIKNDINDWDINIFGDGNEKIELKNRIKEKNLTNVHIMGHSDRIVDEMLKSSIYVMSSRFEGFPMVLGEAMECGLPCISFNCPNGPSDIIKNNVNGYLCKNGDIHDLASKIIDLCHSEERRLSFALEAKKSTELLQLKKITIKWLELIGINNEK